MLRTFVKLFNLSYAVILEQHFHQCFPVITVEKVFWKYTANLQENTHAEVWFW